jgi:hypothetical protein
MCVCAQVVLSTPVAAAGLLVWVGGQLSSQAHYESAYTSTATPLYLRLIALVAKGQPLLAQRILDVLTAALECLCKASQL